MFHLIRFIIWLAGVAVVAYFALGFFGYDINWNYYNESKITCQDRLKECQKDLIRKGLDNAKCDFQCVDPRLIIQKKP